MLCVILAAGLILPFVSHADAEKKTVRVGWFESPFNTTDGFGRRSGYSYEYQRKIAAYTGLDGCRMRCGFHYDYKGLDLTYHKTLPYSTIVEKDPEDGVTYDILYDIVVRQNGEIRSDWDDTVLDVEAYRNVKYEPYDLRVIEGDLKHPTF